MLINDEKCSEIKGKRLINEVKRIMLKILFICHGSDFSQSLIPCLSEDFSEM